MTDPISYDPYLSWVDTTDPDNLPADAKLITAADLLRYENFGVSATAAVNSLITDLATTNSTVATQATTITDLQSTIDGYAALLAHDTTLVKQTDQSRTNSTLFVADNELSRVLLADRTYVVKVVLFMQSPVTADFRVYLNAGAGVTGRWGVSTGLSTTATSSEGASRPLSYSTFDGSGYALIGGTDYASVVVLEAVVNIPAGSNKTLSVYWAQGTADAGNTIVTANSYIWTKAL